MKRGWKVFWVKHDTEVKVHQQLMDNRRWITLNTLTNGTVFKNIYLHSFSMVQDAIFL